MGDREKEVEREMGESVRGREMEGRREREKERERWQEIERGSDGGDVFFSSNTPLACFLASSWRRESVLLRVSLQGSGKVVQLRRTCVLFVCYPTVYECCLGYRVVVCLCVCLCLCVYVSHCESVCVCVCSV